MYAINGIKNETWTISRKADPKEFGFGEKSVEKLAASGKESVLYIMDRVTEGTRKKPQTMLCWRFEKTGQFITVI